MALCHHLATLKLNVTWRCILYPHRVPEELIAAMADAGCVEVSLGFESGSTSVSRAMNKRFDPEEIRSISTLLAKHGIRRLRFLLLGGPGENRESVKESLAFADSLNLELLKVTVGVRIYPGTALAKNAVSEGVISATDNLLFPRFCLQRGLEAWIHDVAPAHTQ